MYIHEAGSEPGPRIDREQVGATETDTVGTTGRKAQTQCPRRKPVSTFSSPFLSVSFRSHTTPQLRNRVDQPCTGATRDQSLLARAARYDVSLTSLQQAMIDEVRTVSYCTFVLRLNRTMGYIPGCKGGQPGLALPPASPSMMAMAWAVFSNAFLAARLPDCMYSYMI